MRKIILFGIFILCFIQAFAQAYNEERTALANFLTRMYNTAPFESVRIVDDYDNSYLISVLSLDNSKYANERVMHRVASVKAMSQASRFFNGSNITSDLIIRKSENSDGSADMDIIEILKEKSVGYVKELELLTTFQKQENEQVFIFYKKIDKKRQ